MALPPLVEPAAELTKEEVARYSRHLIIPDVGMAGQKRLKNAKVLVVGAGGLGSPALLYLAAGVGTLGIVEFDVVDESNLQRQVIHGQADIGRSKAESARDSIREVNPFVEVRLHETRLDSSNVLDIFRDYDLILDGTDNFATRYLVNDAAVLLGKPYVWGSIFRFEGQASVFWEDAPNGQGLNYRDLPRAAAAGNGAFVRGGRRARRAVRVDRLDHGERGDQADHRDRRAAARPAHGVRRPGDELPDDPDPQGPRLEARHRAHRLRRVLWRRLGRRAGRGRGTHDHGDRAQGDDRRGQGLRADRRSRAARVRDREYPGRVLIPKDRIVSGEALSEIPQDKPVVLHCKSGARSADALAALHRAGFRDAVHVGGGVLAWAKQVDPSLPTY